MKNKKINFIDSLKFRLPAPIVIGSLILTVVLFFITSNNFRNELDTNVEQNFKVFEKLFYDQVRAKEQDAIMSMEIMLNNDSLISKFADGDRDGLKDLLLSLYKDKLKKEHDVVQFQFHTPPATSFLRLHKPKKFGDDLSSFRETVISANSSKKVISGIEVGRGGPGLRVVSPISQNGTHLGSVEFGLGIGNIITGIQNALNIEYAIGIKKEVFENAKRFDTKETDILNGNVVFYEYSNKSLKEKLKTQELKKIVMQHEMNDRNYASFVFPINDFANNEVGYIVLYSDITKNVKAMYSTLTQTVLIILGLTSIAAFLMTWLLRKRIIKPLECIGEAANEFSSGNKAVDFEVKTNDELGVLSNSLKIMAEKINTQLQYLDNLPTPVTIIDKEYNVQYINYAAASFAGVEQIEAIGKKCSNLFETAHCGTENCACLKAMELDKSITSETISESNSQKRSIIYTGAPIKNNNGEIIGALESSAEITDIKDKEEYLARSTKQLLQAMNKFANGDLTVKVKPSIEDDDIGKLFKGFNSTVKNIRNLVSNLSDAIITTAKTSNEISTNAEELATSTQEQSSQTADVAAAIEEMAVTVVETTKNVTIAADSAKEAGTTALEGGKVINNTILGIESISNVVTEAASAVELLGASSEKIGAIVEVIDDIAEQTNLLALNAAIEAARAGEHGRGFAVVADEVGKLAERTINATKEISGMIADIQSETGKAVNSIRKGKDEANKGKSFASEASASLEMILSKTDMVIEQISQVATASEEQSSTAEQISKNIEVINSVTQEAANGVQQIANSTENLNQLTEQLRDLVYTFNMDEENFSESYSYSKKMNVTT